MSKNNKTDITKLDTSVSKELKEALDIIGKGTSVRLAELPKVPELQHILSAFPEEKRDDIVLTRHQVEKLLKHLKVSTFGVSNTLPMVCRNNDCPVAELCIFYKMGIAPEGERCPEEIMYMEQILPQFIKDMGVDMENYLEVSMVQEYVSSLLDKRRAERMIAIEGDVKEVATTVIQATGTVIYNEQATPYTEIKEKAARRLQQLRRELLATREQRAKYKLADEGDPSTRAAEMRAKFELLQAKEQQDKKALESSLDKAFKEVE
jgi:hypothetical protein|tara:strand:+ start:1248 stop:2039 length:792 start_codon:yes stop_codon:yes gene_type:complete